LYRGYRDPCRNPQSLRNFVRALGRWTNSLRSTSLRRRNRLCLTSIPKSAATKSSPCAKQGRYPESRIPPEYQYDKKRKLRASKHFTANIKRFHRCTYPNIPQISIIPRTRQGLLSQLTNLGNLLYGDDAFSNLQCGPLTRSM
jgi:hypothetical protein